MKLSATAKASNGQAFSVEITYEKPMDAFRINRAAVQAVDALIGQLMLAEVAVEEIVVRVTGEVR